MRALVYAAGVYSICISCTDAFAPKSAVVSLPTGEKMALGSRRAAIQRLSMKAEDPAEVMARVDGLMGGNSIHTVAASFEKSYEAPAAATKKEWIPYVGYEPRKNSRQADGSARKEDAATLMARANDVAKGAAPDRDQTSAAPGSVPGSKRVSAEDAQAVMARVSAMLATSKASSSNAIPVNSAPAKSWVPYGGYVPRRDKPEAPVPAAATSGSPVLNSESKADIKTVTPAAKKWEPYGGYDPRKDAAVSSASTVLKSDSKTEMKTVSPCDLKLAFFQSHGRPGSAAAEQSSSAQMTSAPASKWQPYGGYDPRSRPAAPSPAAAAEQSSSAPMTSAAAKKWEPYGGYDPKKNAAVSSGSTLLKSEIKAEKKSSGVAEQSSSAPMTTEAAKKWEPYGGYDPRRDSAQLEHSSAAPLTGYLERLEQRLMGEVENMRKSPEMTTASDKKWQPYRGYEPTRHKGDAAVSKNSGAAEQSSSPQMTSAAANKWEPYGGYAPKKDAVSSASTPLKSESDTEMKSTGTRAAAEQSSSPQMTSAAASKWQPYGGYDPRSRPAAPSPAAAAEQSSSAPMTSAAANKWEPYGGYDPKINGAVASASTLLKSESNMSSSAPLTSAAANKWQPYGCYDPRSRPAAAPSPAAASSGAPANKWEPYGGGSVPKRDSPPPPASAASPSYLAPATSAAPSSPLKTDTLSSAPAKKWQPYAGYEPKRDRPPTPAPAASSTPFSAPASYPAPSAPLKADTPSSAPAKKWQPYAGYEPKRERPPTPAPAASSTPFSAPASASYTPSISPAGIAAKPRSDAPAKKWTAPAGYVPASVDPLISAFGSAGSALSSAPAKKWQAYGGYEPKRGATPPTPLAAADARGDRPPAPLASTAAAAAASAASASTLLKSESKTEMKSTGTRAAAEQSSSPQMTSAAASKWQPYGGYDPRSRPAAPSPAAAAEQSSSAPMTSAAAKKWEPYGGYAPKSRPAAPPPATVSAGSPVLESESKVAMTTGTPAAAEQSSSAPMTSAAANKWEPYGGYAPRSRPAAAPSPAAASSGASAVKSESNARVQTQPQRSPVSAAEVAPPAALLKSAPPPQSVTSPPPERNPPPQQRLLLQHPLPFLLSGSCSVPLPLHLLLRLPASPFLRLSDTCQTSDLCLPQ